MPSLTSSIACLSFASFRTKVYQKYRNTAYRNIQKNQHTTVNFWICNTVNMTNNHACKSTRSITVLKKTMIKNTPQYRCHTVKSSQPGVLEMYNFITEN